MKLQLLSFRGEEQIDAVNSLKCETSAGWLEILPGHQDYFVDLKKGYLVVKTDKKLFFQVSRGFLKISQGSLQISAALLEPFSPDQRAQYEESLIALEEALECLERTLEMECLKDRIALCDRIHSAI